MERVVARDHGTAAVKRVRQNKGSPGVDGMTVEELPPYLAAHWEAIRAQLLDGHLPAEAGAGSGDSEARRRGATRGIPTVLDRFIQQSLLQVLQPHVRPDLFRAQLWLPAWAQRTPRGGRGAAVHPGREAGGGGRGPGEVLRPGQPRRTDGEAGAAHRGQAGAGAASAATWRPASWPPGW